MSMEILEHYFRIKPDQSINDGRHVRYIVNDSLYTIITVTNLEQKALIELYEMSEHMAKYGDKKVSVFVPNDDGKFLVTHQNQDYVLLKNRYTRPSRMKNPGRKLGKFHARGQALQVELSTVNRVGQWKSLWEKRLEQMEKVWGSMVYEEPRERFEKLFIESFPYYLGLCENAIQYVVDTELDGEPSFMDKGTICHERFPSDAWENELGIRSPFDWVYDHPGRDIAEWIRNCYFRSSRTLQPDLMDFLQGYESVLPISPFSWRLIYGRLLFPLHYFECVEEYFNSPIEGKQIELEERLRRYMRDTKEHEAFLRSFYELVGVRNLPVLEWL